MGLPELHPAPARLLSSSCSVEKTVQCSCSFHGVPTPSVQWLVEDAPMGMRKVNSGLQVTSTTLGPWANSTIHLIKDPNTGTSILCEGKNANGTHALSILLMSRRSPQAPGAFLKGMIQGVVYGAIVITLIFLCLFPIILKCIKTKPKKKAAMIESQRSPEVKRSHISKRSLRPEAPGKLMLTSSECWVLASRDKLNPVETETHVNFPLSSDLQESTKTIEIPETLVPLKSQISKPSPPPPLPHTASPLHMSYPGMPLSLENL
ncbi:SIGLEC family-like protein 1 [Perognathus longimembris pacificus]|uniref:SIGLEC family-like protein 1 n=1 Tax=Perognathus longimembris pacificus TaxID=214514 RepID=UPI0020193ADE|nr:SIGLEC family-like protein 1 [Perognathus longimembris pacificus]